MSNVQIQVGGTSFGGWTGFEVTASVKNACRTFSLNMAEIPGGIWALMAGNPCQVFCDQGLLIDGYIDDFSPGFSANSHDITVSGRSKSADFVDCAAIYKKGNIKKETILKIGQLLAEPFGVNIESDEELEKIPNFQIKQGETCFEALERLAKTQGLLLIGTANGGIDITKAKDKRQAGALIEGKNIINARATFSHSKRFSEYIIKGQSKSDGKLKHNENDTGITRHRPTIIVADGDLDNSRCEKRAIWTKDRAAGEGTRATITVQGMADTINDLFEPNNLIFLNSEKLKISQDMLIEAVTFSKNSSGTFSSLTLVDPRAYGGEAQQTSGSGGGFA